MLCVSCVNVVCVVCVGGGEGRREGRKATHNDTLHRNDADT